jgi:alkylation response protein AidB-like acyl-CoA dehydrogenase
MTAQAGARPDVKAFRDEFRGWLEEHLPPEWRDLSRGTPEEQLVPVRRAWGRRLCEHGWLGVTWPETAGGRGLGLEHETALVEEQVDAGAPEPLNSNGIQIFGPLLLRHGTEAQQRRFLPVLLAHDEIWCQGFSEPDAGSDLANLKTRAVRDGDGWRLEGQKVWTTYAHEADRCYVLARTELGTPRKQDGISLFAVDMRQPSVTFRPLRNITGSFEFNEVFFDGAQLEADGLIGVEGRGWPIAMEALAYERGLSFAQRAMKLIREFGLVAAIPDAVPVGHDDDLVGAFVATRAMRSLVLEMLERSSSGKDLGPIASIAKLFWSEAHQELLRLATERSGDDLTTEALRHWLGARLSARGETVYGGTSEIQRNLIARSLGLPSVR